MSEPTNQDADGTDKEKYTDAETKLVDDIIKDKRTVGWTFAAVSDDGRATSFGESDGEERTFEAICAATLIQFASASEKDQTNFLKEVISEFNDRKDSATANHGVFPNDD